VAIEDDEYARVLAQLAEAFPGLADQIDSELRRGRVVSKQDLYQSGMYEERASRLAATELPPLGKTDVAVIPYTGDERLELVREALITMAETMYESRLAVLEIATNWNMQPNVEFGEPEVGSWSRLDLRSEMEATFVALRRVSELLSYSRDSGSEVER
jgi:hypothetical protein